MNPLLTDAITAARKAGAEIMRHYASTDFETKEDGSPVTIADTRSNEILTEHLNKTGIALLSEESGEIALPYPDRLWIIDPLDGTKDFILKNGDFAVMIGLIEKGRPILGVVYVPAHDTLYYAERGTGAFMNTGGVVYTLQVSNRSENDLRCIRSINHFSPRMEAIAEQLHATFIPRGSFGVKAGVLAEGTGDYFASLGNFGEWDVCAPEIIATEAGATVSDCNGNQLFYGTKDHRVEHGIVFSNGVCHARVLKAIRTTTEMV
jgi:3'(2'), 5'-bisphosphate nucleotidase